MATKLLIVDDEPNICESLRLYLESEGYEVKIANDGVDGVSYFKMYEPDIVLLDIMMPRKDGWQVCREIREVSSRPIIMLTAKGETFDKVLCLELGADDYVVKPFEGKELVARVKAVLRRSVSDEKQEEKESRFKFVNAFRKHEDEKRREYAEYKLDKFKKKQEKLKEKNEKSRKK
jgi:DNA-binding response OmpR family regulator